MRRRGVRKLVNNLMLAATGVCTLLTVSVLFVILGYLVCNGGKSIDWDFFTKLPLPQGKGRRHGQRHCGQCRWWCLAAVIGLPVGFLGGVYLAEFGGKAFASRALHGGPAQRRTLHRNWRVRLDGGGGADAVISRRWPAAWPWA